jgi:hypothetical protein
MDNKNQSAFPDTRRAAAQSFSNQAPEDLPVGLTKLEYIATHITLSENVDGFTNTTLANLVGREMPPAGDSIKYVEWWAEAEAKVRVMKAKALLTELSK